MLVSLTPQLKDLLRQKGVESFHGAGVNISSQAIFEPPCSIKWMGIENAFQLGAFSYAVSGFFSSVMIGRYTSIGEQVQIGRASHPTNWTSTSPFFYLQDRLFDVGDGFKDAESYLKYGAPARHSVQATSFKSVIIGNDVYIGHGACIMPGVTIGDGAIVGAMSVVTKNVPAYGIVAGNPARLIRSRLDPIIFAQMLHLQWWRYAPWQLRDVDFSDPGAAIPGIKQVIENEEPYEPGLLSINELLTDL